MGFNVAADAYGQFMGRYSEPLAEQFIDVVGARRGQRALDVGAGPGALTALLVDRLGAGDVAALDPSAPFVEALRRRLPEVDVRQTGAESIPFPDNDFDLAVAQLVVHFMPDPVKGLTEMGRVTKPGGIVGASVWDYAGERGPHSLFWRAARDLDPVGRDESGLAGVRDGHLVELFGKAGLDRVDGGSLTVRVAYPDFDSWWQPCTLGVGPVGSYVAGLDQEHRAALRLRCAELWSSGPVVVDATAWTAIGIV